MAAVPRLRVHGPLFLWHFGVSGKAKKQHVEGFLRVRPAEAYVGKHSVITTQGLKKVPFWAVYYNP